MLKSLWGRVARGPVAVPDEPWETALARLPFVARLATTDRARLRGLVGEFLRDKEMAGAAGLELTVAIEVSIAVQACLPVLNLGLEWYRGWNSIVVYPGEFLVPRRVTDEDGIVHEYAEPITGEAWDGGPLLLSWEDAQAPGSADGAPYSVVVHEFAHKLDLLNGEADGVPPFSPTLHPGLDANRWRRTLSDAYQRFVAELELIGQELPPGVDPDSSDADAYYEHLPLDAYAAQDDGEFFAVSSEAFFVDPARLQRAFPDWYDLLAAYYRQDPLGSS
jgi:Mlc titration factor MtfA (ptsG expression regulator)